ncbi:UNVERIFIED_CONTAM: hypothetical protein Scaly_2554800 [Sesamum calycinum]|uniref:Aminotransferase-like plant mobile domain-containing protein n=1 Tax=Sesamum calycinum TaxID=2727403 RepID=A0AAW2IXD4_9LAMI
MGRMMKTRGLMITVFLYSTNSALLLLALLFFERLGEVSEDSSNNIRRCQWGSVFDCLRDNHAQQFTKKGHYDKTERKKSDVEEPNPIFVSALLSPEEEEQYFKTLNDLVVKTKKREEHMTNLQIVFDRLRKYNLRMNLLKCAFGIMSGKFLSFIVRHRGIEVDPAKMNRNRTHQFIVFEAVSDASTRHLAVGYWEWTEDVLSRCRDRLRLINVYDVVYAFLFTYDHNSDIIKAFCEAWCPFTNTLLTSSGELSISLWDLHDLVGFSMTGYLCDVVVPSADGSQWSSVSIDKWVKFWFKKDIKYHPLPSHKEKKMVRPELTHDLFRDIATHERWSTVEDALFAELCIKGNLKKEDYLAAHLACWLYTFALPDEDVNSICLSTLEMASMTVSDRRVSLTIPVLSLSSEKLSKSLLEQQLREAKDRFQDAQVKASEETSKVQSTMAMLERIENEIVDLKEQKTSLCATLKRQKQLSHNAQNKVHEIEEDIAALENPPH